MPDNFLEPDTTRASLVGDVLFPLPAHRRSAMGILTWWESRRLVYNVIVGATGVASLVFITGISHLPPGIPRLFPPWQVILAYGAMANVCFTLGPAVEIVLQRFCQGRVLAIGPVLFRQGLAFSIGLTMLPVFVAGAMWIVRAGTWLFGRAAV